MSAEFDLIARYFTRPAPDGMLGVGDDCALLSTTPGMQLAVSADLLVENRHFFPDVAPDALGHKSLAVNLSDLAAMGARPLGCVLSLSLPRVDHDWLTAFSGAFHALAEQAGCPLVGGDTVRSADGITIGVTVMGQVAPDQALRRAGAKAGDDIWVSGELGAADVALRLLQGRLAPDAALLAQTRQALEWPQPQLALGQALAGLAHAAIDISDGLAQDLGHILAASHCGAELHVDSLPIAPALLGLPVDVQYDAALSGGDVYQLCFTAAAVDADAVMACAKRAGVRVTRVGRIVPAAGLRILDAAGACLSLRQQGFDHFS